MQIEVEQNFQPTEEQMSKLLDGAEFLGDKIINDKYFDLPDYSLHKNGVYLRNRNGDFELKIKKNIGDMKVKEEIENIDEIKKYFNTNKNLEDFTREDMVIFYEYVNNRKKYKKEDFTIDIDNLDFGYKMVEIELLVSDESKIKEATEKIRNFVSSYGISFDKVQTKREAYLKKFKPEVFGELFG